MFDAIIRFSLKNRLLVVVLAALLLVYGGFVISKLPVDVFPDLNRPTVTIFTEAEGLAPEEVETLVTWPLETAINGSSGVQRVRSASSAGLSIIWVEFDWGTDIYIDRQIVAEKLQQAGETLPAGAKPVMGPISSIMGEILLIGLTSENPAVNSMDLRSIADWDLRTRLLSLSGISQITVIGGDVKQYQVLVDPFKLTHYKATLREVEETVRGSNVNSTGGFLLSGYQESMVRNIARVKTLDDLATSPLPRPDGPLAPLTLGHVANVKFGGPLAKRGDASIDGLALFAPHVEPHRYAA